MSCENWRLCFYQLHTYCPACGEDFHFCESHGGAESLATSMREHLRKAGCQPILSVIREIREIEDRREIIVHGPPKFVGTKLEEGRQWQCRKCGKDTKTVEEWGWDQCVECKQGKVGVGSGLRLVKEPEGEKEKDSTVERFKLLEIDK